MQGQGTLKVKHGTSRLRDGIDRDRARTGPARDLWGLHRHLRDLQLILRGAGFC